MEFTQRQWEEWRGRRSLLEKKVKAAGFEVKGWMNGKPTVPRMFPKDLAAIALSITELRAKYSTPPAPEPEPEATVESGETREDKIEAMMQEFTRDELREKLKAADISFSYRALERNLAEKVVDAGL